MTHEDVLLYGDDQGYINVLKIVAKDLNIKNTKNGDKKQANPNLIQNYPIEPDKLTK